MPGFKACRVKSSFQDLSFYDSSFQVPRFKPASRSQSSQDSSLQDTYIQARDVLPLEIAGQEEEHVSIIDVLGTYFRDNHFCSDSQIRSGNGQEFSSRPHGKVWVGL